jgi:hypothetical protein
LTNFSKNLLNQRKPASILSTGTTNNIGSQDEATPLPV